MTDTMTGTTTDTMTGRTTGKTSGARGTAVCGAPGRGDLDSEIVTVADLARQVGTAELLLEQLELMTRIPRDWALDLPERLTAAPWSVEGVTTAGGHVSESAQDLTALGEAVGALRTAITAAAGAGELAAAGRAHGQAEGLVRD